MKIAINATILDDKPTGLGVYTKNVIKELCSLIGDEHQIIVYTSSPDLFEGLNIEVKKISKKVQPKYGKKAGIYRLVWSQINFPIFIMKDEVNLVYNPTHHGSFFINKPQVITIPDILAIKFPERYKLQYLYFKNIVPFILKNTKALITYSENSKKDIAEFYGYPSSRIFVSYCGVDNKIFFPREQKEVNLFFKKYSLDMNYILLIGASYLHKNLERAIEAYSKVSKALDISLLIIGGRSSYIDLLKEKAIKMNIIKRVKFLDYIQDEDLPMLYTGAKTLVFPSLYEGFGLPPLEAMACGCPVVVSNAASLPEVCVEAAYYVDPYNTENITEGIYKVLTDENLRDTLIQKGFERVKLFSWKKTAKEVLTVFKEVLK